MEEGREQEAIYLMLKRSTIAKTCHYCCLKTLTSRHGAAMALLPSIIANPTNSRPHQPLVIVQSSASQTCLPVLRRLIRPAKLPTQTLLFCFLYPPASLIKGWPDTSDESLKAFDYTERIPRYNVSHDSRDEILAAVSSGLGPSDVRVQTLILASTAPLGSLNVIIDSVDTLASDLASDSQTYRFMRSLLNTITSRSRV
jgi:elongator complex protein 5